MHNSYFCLYASVSFPCDIVQHGHRIYLFVTALLNIATRIAMNPLVLIFGLKSCHYVLTARIINLIIGRSSWHFSYFSSFYASQKKTLELNPGHPLVKELLKRVTADAKDETAKDLANVLFETATLRSGYIIKVITFFLQFEC